MDHPFYVGAATAAHQVEGNNKKSDCWVQENEKYTTYQEKSLDAVDHYHRYEEDIERLAAAGYNAYRFSVEWARIEPEEGVFDEQEVQHYQDVIACCKRNGIEPVVTLHHFSSPAWIITKGGWEADSIVRDFRDYVAFLIPRIGRDVHYICTINEANMRLQIGRLMEVYSRLLGKKAGAENLQVGVNIEAMKKLQEKSEEENRKAFHLPEGGKVWSFASPCTKHGDELILEAHAAAREVIREYDPSIRVGLTLSLHDIQEAEGGSRKAEEIWDEEFRHYLPVIGEDDFIGVQNYTREIVGREGVLPVPEGAEKTQAGYEYYPEGLAHVIERVARDYHGEILVTENGIATDDDERRIAFIDTALAGVQQCRKTGIPVGGYFHWSLLDNFEWQRGFLMHFGLIAVDRKNGQVRHEKASFQHLGKMTALLQDAQS